MTYRMRSGRSTPELIPRPLGEKRPYTSDSTNIEWVIYKDIVLRVRISLRVLYQKCADGPTFTPPSHPPRNPPLEN